MQGDVVEHLGAFARIGAPAIAVKTRAELDAVAGLVIPGGESTTVMRLLDRFGLAEHLRNRVHAGLPLWGTCMGMIVAARDVAQTPQPTLGLIDITVRRNAFGRQLASEEITLDVPVLGSAPFPAIFIRAPWIERAGPGVEVLATYRGHGVFVRQGNMLGTSFHPELTHDDRLHAYFRDMVREASSAAARRVSHALSA
ncbi:MAG: pyridoxal 5'-phosphate synthase glutaminase subunit PdxT [Candidatus Eremiobacteraeota bacterium]|nr:pyridoxal 5'-phosphate synthase glutaminase subunit PdxT [Candidatus Eremiobacteraeota bacterium]